MWKGSEGGECGREAPDLLRVVVALQLAQVDEPAAVHAPHAAAGAGVDKGAPLGEDAALGVGGPGFSTTSLTSSPLWSYW